MKDIKNIERPTTLTELRSFIGLVGYYRRFIPDFGKICKCLNKATKKDQPKKVVWTEEMDQSFVMLKSSLCNYVKLTIPVCTDTFIR